MNVFEENKFKEITGEQLNSYNIKFYKFINKEMCHIGLHYHIGEIIDPIEFNPNDTCSKGGIYFSTFDHIFKFLKYGCFLCEIEIPNNTRCYVENIKIKANKIVIKNMIHIDNLFYLYDESVSLKCVKQNGALLQYIKDLKQTEEMCFEAIKQKWNYLKYVKKQTKEICFLAIKQDGEALECVKEQTEEICLEAVKQDGFALHFVKEQTEEICLEAVKQNGYALQFVEEKFINEKMFFKDIKQNGYDLQFVEENFINEKMFFKAIKQNGLVLEFIEKKFINEELCLEAVKQNGMALEFIENQTEEICLEAIKQNPNSLKHVEEQTEQICSEAVKHYGPSLEYVEEQTEEICLEAIKQNICSLDNVKDQQIKQVCIMDIKKNNSEYKKNNSEYKHWFDINNSSFSTPQNINSTLNINIGLILTMVPSQHHKI
jgi:hypothetical protein